jgi:hypothetical protein
MIFAELGILIYGKIDGWIKQVKGLFDGKNKGAKDSGSGVKESGSEADGNG